MEPNVPSDELLDEVEQRIGRNVLLFQRLEGVLKFLLAYGNVSGYISEIKANHEQQISSIGKQTLGQLVGQFTANVLSNFEEIPNEPEEFKDTWFSVNFKVQHDELKKSLTLVVLERNELIHHLLPKFDLSSTEGARAAIEYLDQQREKVRPTFATLKSIITTVQDARKDIAAFYASDEGP